MLNLFTIPHNRRLANALPVDWSNLRKHYLKEISNVVNYYRTRAISVRNSHFLALLNDNMKSDTLLNYATYLSVSNIQKDKTERTYKLTTPYLFGEVRNSAFFPDSDDIYISHSEENYSGLWTDKLAFSFLRHDESDISFCIPHKDRYRSSVIGLNVVQCDLVLMALMYRAFTKSKEGDVSSERFVLQYLLPNMLSGYLDLAIMNRLMNLFYGYENSEVVSRSPIIVNTFKNRLDSILSQVLKKITSIKPDYIRILNEIPSINNESMLHSLKIPDVAATRQIKWSLYVSRIRIMGFLLDLGGSTGIQINRNYINDVIPDIRRMNKNNLMLSMLPLEDYIETTDIFSKFERVL